MIEIAGYLINPSHVAYVEPPHTYQGGTADTRLMKIGFSGGATLDLKFLTEKEAAEARATIDFHVKK